MKKILGLSAIAAGLGLAAVAPAVYSAVGVNSISLRNAVTVAKIRAHQAALQVAADGNGGNRAAGTGGHLDSLEYIEGKLLAANYFNVSRQQFTFPLFTETAPPVFQQVAPAAVTYTEGTDFSTMQYSGSGNVTASMFKAGGFVLPPTADPSSASGCSPSDFTGIVAGQIALIQRGSCTFFQKATNAAAAGASAAIIFNEGNPGRTDDFGGTLGEPMSIPVFSASFAVGNALAALSTATLHVEASTLNETKTTWNLVANTKTGRTDRVVVVGAHLDSVPEGPGIEDNGSGSASNLEIALQFAALKISPVNQVRFAWWSAEEAGLLGSEHYVANLTKTQKQHIALNLNFDMIASPNFVRYVYDGDGSDTPDAGPNGSAVIEDVFAKYFRSQGQAFAPTAFDGRSDYGPFIDAGIPAGGLFTGAEDLKTRAEFLTFGGTEGAALDPCYHQACDDYANNNETVLDQMSDAAADAILQFAMTTSAVKGTSKANDQAVKSVEAESLLYKGGHLQR